MKNPEEEALNRLDALERKVSEIDHNIIRLMTLLGHKESVDSPSNGNSGQPVGTPLKRRRVRSGSVPTSAQTASISDVSSQMFQ